MVICAVKKLLTVLGANYVLKGCSSFFLVILSQFFSPGSPGNIFEEFSPCFAVLKLELMGTKAKR